MKKILTILTITLTLTITGTLTVAAQTGRQLKVYMKGGLVDKVQVATDASIGHSRTDLNGTVHDDYVSAVVKDAEGRERQYLISQLDSLVMPNGRRVVFVGNQNGYVNVNGNDDENQNENDNENQNENQNENENGSRSLKRSSFSGKFPGAGTGNVTFKWTENDRIRLDVGYESRAEQLSADGTSASFVFDEADDFQAEHYMVYFPDRRVTIKSVQTQTGANNSLHIYDSGDCGTAIATRNGNDNGNENDNENENSEHPSSNTTNPSPTTYTFTLEHKAAYLCFLPHIDNLPSAKLTKITLSCSAAIAGIYQLSGNGLYNGTATSSTITLNLVPQKNIDFFIGHDALTEQDSCAAYMVIAPQGSSQTFTATYYITDTLSHISKVYRQTFSFQPVANTVYPVTCHILDEEFRTIDLGLSCNWSNVNVGAREPSKTGSTFDSDAKANAALLEQTVVTQWLMPDEDQREEILEKCRWTFGIYNAQTGYFVEGAAVAKEYGEKLRIFLPWTGNGTPTPSECLAQNYRPVEVLMVDLGLSSGVKWAARNIGATSVEDYGHYYAWGEVETKESYTSDNYKYGTQNLGNNYDISGTQNDAAVVNWGGVWRMPTNVEFKELIDSCNWVWSSINGVRGYTITKKKNGTGNKIFLPAAGLMSGNSLSHGGSGGSYPTSIQAADRSSYAWTVTFSSETIVRTNTSNSSPFGYDYRYYNSSRSYGRPVRPVAAPNAVAPDGTAFNITTDSASWQLGDRQTTLYGTLSSTTPFKGNVKVGFVVGDSANIERGDAEVRFDLSQIVTVGGRFSQTLAVYDNIGYWYRAYVGYEREQGDTVYYYGDARHYGYEMVDLGLSVKWANMNIGADTPSDYGYYYAWGETETKDNYTEATYLYRKNIEGSWTYINLGDNLDISGTENDAAHVVMGNAWRMPTYAELDELLDDSKCKWTWTSENNVNGYRVTSRKNGKSIFLPSSGLMVGTSCSHLTDGSSYPTSKQAGDRNSFAWTVSFTSSSIVRTNTTNSSPFSYDNRYHNAFRCYGRPIRAVAAPNQMTADGMSLNVSTDSTSWRLDHQQATLYATLSSTAPLNKSVTVGFLVGDSANIVKNSPYVRHNLHHDVVESGVFTETLPVHDNIGYYYRAYVETSDTIFYGKARHYGLELVDMGLSVMWANMNVGASAPEEFGHYYAWGETAFKDDYSLGTYKHYDSSRSAYVNLGDSLDISGTEDDAAHVTMGNGWRMPTYREMNELLDDSKCKWTWTSENNVNGYRVTSLTTGNSIFLPATGLMIGVSPKYTTSGSSYLTACQAEDRSSFAWTVSFTSSSIIFKDATDSRPFSYDQRYYNATRYYGRPVRAVFMPSGTTADGNRLTIHTDSSVWEWNRPKAKLYATFSSTIKIENPVSAGFIVGDSASIVKGKERYDLSQTLTSTGVFCDSVEVAGNMGYWYRAYIIAGDGTVFYGDARHVGLEMVDLGLPSRTLWANMNVGANRPEDYGGYFAWGKISEKISYSSGSYVSPGLDSIQATNYDVAWMNMGNNWMMPSKKQYEELRNSSNCIWEWTVQNDVTGYRVRSVRNNNQIFLPATGLKVDSSTPYREIGTSYQSATTGTDGNCVFTMTCYTPSAGQTKYALTGASNNIFSYDARFYPVYRWYGRPVRAVAVQKAPRP